MSVIMSLGVILFTAFIICILQSGGVWCASDSGEQLAKMSCYNCTSVQHPHCGDDPFVERDSFKVHGACNFCVKLKVKLAMGSQQQQQHVIRTCSSNSAEFHDIFGSERDACEELRDDSQYGTGTLCLCTGDLCNSSSALPLLYWRTLILALLVYTIISALLSYCIITFTD